MNGATAAVIPAEVLAKVKNGHALEPDPPYGLSSASRWTCRRCGGAVLWSDTGQVALVVWGSVTERVCKQDVSSPTVGAL